MPVAIHCRFDVAFLAFSNFGPVARHFRIVLSIFAPIADYFCSELAIFVEGAHHFLRDLTNLKPVDCHSRLDLTSSVSVTRDFYFLDPIFFAAAAVLFSDLMLFTPVARQFRY